MFATNSRYCFSLLVEQKEAVRPGIRDHVWSQVFWTAVENLSRLQKEIYGPAALNKWDSSSTGLCRQERERDGEGQICFTSGYNLLTYDQKKKYF